MKEVKIDKRAVSRAVKKPLEEYYRETRNKTHYEDFERPGNWEENKDLLNSLSKSKYISTHLDWPYVLQLIYAILDHNHKLKAEDFAEKLEDLIIQTREHRDYLAIIPIAFSKPFGFFGNRSTAISRTFSIGKFKFHPPATTLGKMNKIITNNNYGPIDIDSYEHAKRSSHGAFGDEVLVTFTTHGSEDQLRYSAQGEFTVLSRLMELFASLFSDDHKSYREKNSANHFFLLSKTNQGLRRFPTLKPSAFDFELNSDFINCVKRSEFSVFLNDLLESEESMHNRMRNALKFFSMAFNTKEKVSSFIFYIISIESIFSRESSAPIKATLADFSSMLCFSPKHRLEAYQALRRMYDLRSAIVHSGTSAVKSTDIETARSYAARAIFCSLFLCDRLRIGKGKLQDRFFDHLRNRKLNLTKPLVPKSIWSLPLVREA